MEKSPVKTEIDDNESNLEKGLLTSREKPNPLLDSQVKPNSRRDFPLDQRGSMNTDIRRTRLRSNLLSYRGSVSGRSSLSRGGQSQFSFHPSINYNSEWRPKYDDHHDHKQMVTRMHKEMQKIQAKKRLASEQRKLEEISQCTFKPKLVAKPTKSSLYRKSQSNSNLLGSAENEGEPADITHLSSRLYKYAEKFKEKKEQKKQQIEDERGQEIRFAPKLETDKFNTELLGKVRSSSKVYSNLYEDSVRRADTKSFLELKRNELKSKKPQLLNEDITLTFSKPARTPQGKKFSLAFGKKEHVKFNNQATTSPQHFSSSLYTAHRPQTKTDK